MSPMPFARTSRLTYNPQAEEHLTQAWLMCKTDALKNKE